MKLVGFSEDQQKVLDAMCREKSPIKIEIKSNSYSGDFEILPTG